MLNPFTHRRSQRKILENGRPGRARLVERGPFPGSGHHPQQFRLRMVLHVEVEGGAPYEVEDEWLVPGEETAALTLAETEPIPVRVDRDEPRKVAIDWDGVRRQYEEHRQARRSELRSRGSIDPAD